MKKVLYVHHSGNSGGAPRSLAFLLKNLDRTLYEPVIWMLRDGDARKLFELTKAEIIISHNKFLYPFHGSTVTGMSLKIFLQNLVGLIPMLFTAFKIIKQVKPEVIHLTSTCSFHFAFIAKKFFKDIHVVSHIREPLLPNFFGNILLFFNSKNVDRFIAISANDAAPFKRKGCKVDIINNFVDLKEYNPDNLIRIEFRDKLKLDEKDILVSSFSRIDPSNGQLNIIQIAESSKLNSNIKFLICGYEGKSEYEKTVMNSAPTNVTVMSMINNVSDYLNASDILISSFTTPHFARAVVEASAMGVPSIISNVDSQNELILDKQTGFKYDSIDDAVESLNFLAQNKSDRLEMGRNARIFAEEKFDSVKNSLDTFKAYL